LVFAWAAIIAIKEKLVQEVKSLTFEQTRILTDRLQMELGITTTSFAPTGVMVGGGAAEVVTEVAFVMEQKTTFTLLIFFLLFLRFYCSYNKNTRKEK
jgi:hypothetical protein